MTFRGLARRVVPTPRLTAVLVTLALLSPLSPLAVVSLSAQTKIVPPPNKYSPADDVRLGQQASAQVLRKMPMLDDPAVDEYVAGIGQRLVAAIPPEFQYPEFHYTFRVVDKQEINAFALPGGPMYLNRGMIEAAHDEGEIAGVMAHEMSHVMLRHGTAQQTKGEKFKIGSVAGQVLGAVVGGPAGALISVGSTVGVSAYFMKFSREDESQADINGAQLMARAGYDPRDMANIFKTIAEKGGNGPEWLSDHPDPGNRSDRINKEAAMLHIEGHAGDNPANFDSIQARLKGLSPALDPSGSSGRIVDVDAPSDVLRTFDASSMLRVSVPSNWEQVAAANDSVTYAPQGASFPRGAGNVFTHGVEVGTSPGTGSLRRDTDAVLATFAEANPRLQQAAAERNDRIGGRAAITILLANVSEITGQREYVWLSTTRMRDGALLYVIGVAPQGDARTYDALFKRIRQSIEIADK